MYKQLFLYCIICFTLINCVSADHIITNILPENEETCVLSGNITFKYYIDEEANLGCDLWTNSSGTWKIDLYDITANLGYNTFGYEINTPNTVLWRLQCSDTVTPDIDYSTVNTTFTVTDAPYCAVLSETTCSTTGALGSEFIFKTRLGNTKGIWLENQDCNVWIEDSSGVIVKKFNSMGVNQETAIQLDSDGNWINTASKDTILTDSQGYYIYPFVVNSNWAYYGESYTVKTVCNGQTTSCDFNVTKQKLPDIDNYEALGKEASGLIFVLLIFFIILFYLIKEVRRRL